MATALEQLDISRFPSVALIDTQPVVSKEDSKAIPGASSPEALPFIFGNLQGSQTEAVAASKFGTQTITTGTQEAHSEGDKRSLNTSPRSVFEGPMFSATTIPAMMPGKQSHSGTVSQDSFDWRLGSDDDKHFDDDDLGSEAQDNEGSGAEGDESNLRRSARNHQSSIRKPREKRKVGRPIIYTGDPDAPDLTPQERRRIRRRIANRESARRVRAKRQDLLEEMAIKAKQLETFNAKLMERATSAEAKQQAMMQQFAQISECLRVQTAENERLQAEVASLRQSMSVMNSPQVDMDNVKAALGGTNFMLTVVPPGPLQQPAVLPQTVSSGFSNSPFSAASILPPLDAVEPSAQLATVTSGAPASSATAAAVVEENPLPMPHPARVLSKALSVEQVMAAMSIDPLDRSLSEFLKEVACF